MQMYDIDRLVRDANQDNLYNFFEPTFYTKNGIDLGAYFSEKDTEMRMDLICDKIYSNVDYVDLLCDVNDIDNPLNVMERDIILYPPVDLIPEYRPTNTNTEEVRNRLLNSNKTSKKDNNRKNYVENNFNLPPTIREVPAPSVSVEGDSIVIG